MLTAEQLAHVDIYGVFDRRLGLGKKEANTHGGEYWTMCPFCGTGDDRFKVWPFRSQAEDSTLHYWCRQCRVIGDVVRFVMEVEGRDFFDVCEELQIPLDGEYVSSAPKRRHYNPHDNLPPSKEWQEAATSFAIVCKNTLWSEEGKKALEWLRGRGLSDDTISAYGLGYNPSTRYDAPSSWHIEQDKKIWLPRGITIPWAVGPHLWAINIRRSNADIKKDKERGVKKPSKYVLVKGSGEGIYGIDYFDYNKPTLLVEGEFDKLIAGQTAGANFNTLATGSISKARGEKWALTIAQSPVVLIGYDADGKGEKAAIGYWVKAIPHAAFWPPTSGKDYNDMYLSGQDIQGWLETGVEMVNDSLIKVQPAPMPVVPSILSLDTILASRTIEAQYDTTVPAGSLCCQCSSIATFISPSGFTYCDTCYWCRRGHRPIWRKDPVIRKSDDTPLWLCSCFWQES